MRVVKLIVCGASEARARDLVQDLDVEAKRSLQTGKIEHVVTWEGASHPIEGHLLLYLNKNTFSGVNGDTEYDGSVANMVLNFMQRRVRSPCNS